MAYNLVQVYASVEEHNGDILYRITGNTGRFTRREPKHNLDGGLERADMI